MPPPPTRRAVPAAILTAGVLAAVAILVGYARDSIPPPLQPVPQLGLVARTPDGPATPQPWTPDGR